jgi:hypothetical protein
VLLLEKVLLLENTSSSAGNAVALEEHPTADRWRRSC